ncbi:HNH endonuclease signature motif containing protein [Methylobacterium ajmalii]|uniref:HNH endonuclease signature motif containing protein n=1 Tax=Methylobacterium ajmalii TaxID=2738439 RepID=A0ABV0A390_9HYPH
MSEFLSVEMLKSLLVYNPATGVFYWIQPKVLQKLRPDGRAGSLGRNGYEYIRVNGKLYLSHRLAILYMTGSRPEADVDHINGDTSDNRWVNLRGATRQQNLWNSSPRAKKIVRQKGVWRYKQGYRASIYVDGRSRHLGVYSSAEEAHAAYAAAAVRLRGEFART